MRKALCTATANLAGLALLLTSCAASTETPQSNDLSSLGTPATDRGTLSVTLDSGRKAEIEISRYKSVSTTGAEIPKLLDSCSVKHSSESLTATALHVVEIKGKVTFTGEGDGESVMLYAHSGSRDAPDKIFRVSSCDGGDQQTLAKDGEFTEQLFVFEENKPGYYTASPEKVFFSVQTAAKGKQHLTKENCEAKGGSESSIPDICLLGLAE